MILFLTEIFSIKLVAYCANAITSVQIAIEFVQPRWIVIDRIILNFNQILGPLLFILYINDILFQLGDDAIISFVDDTSVISTGKTWKIAVTKINNFLKVVHIVGNYRLI